MLLLQSIFITLEKYIVVKKYLTGILKILTSV